MKTLQRIKPEILLTAIVIIIFCVAGSVSAFSIIEENNKIREVAAGGQSYEASPEEHAFLFFYIVLMAFSGFALMALLITKIGRLEKMHLENQRIMGLLQPRMAAVESAKDGIGIADAEGNIRFVNRALALYHGYDNVEDLSGRPWHVLYTENQKSWMETEVLPILEIRGYWAGHCRGLRRDGSEFIQDVAMTYLEDGGWVWVLRDYSEMIETITTSNRRLAAIEAAGDGIGLVDREGRLTYINKALMELHAIPREGIDDYIGQPWEKLYTAQGIEEIHRKVMPLLRKNKHWKGEAPLKRADGKIIFAEMSLTLLPDGGLIGTARDISDRKKAEKEKDDLQKQFFHAQKMEAIGRLAGGIAHDFNNILASMLGYAEFLTEDLDPASKQHKFAQQIMSGGTQAKKLVEQILTFSRRKESARDILMLSEAVNETANILRATIPPTITLDIQINTGNSEISANSSQISQVLMNLCVNARDAMEKEEGILAVHVDRVAGRDITPETIVSDSSPAANYAPESRLYEASRNETTVLIGHVGRDSDYIRVCVIDNGCGMTREVMEHIFEPFFTTKDMDRGTGLGLSTVHGMIAGHQGAIIVKSCPGKGTCFELYFPAVEARAETARGKAGVADVRTHGIDGAKILLVEDEAQVRSMMMQMLERIGCEAQECVSGPSALDILREKPGYYDIILSDHLMPGMTGLEMARELRKGGIDIPIVLLSGYSKEKLTEALNDKEAGIEAFLRKPTDSRTLSETINGVLRDRRKAA